MDADAFPLDWPPGWPRTSDLDRVNGRHHFKRPGGKYGRVPWSFGAARDALIEEIHRLNGGGPIVISSNFRAARDGYPVEGSKRPVDQGVAVYFDLAGKTMVMACDRYTGAEENMRSIALAIEAMRQLERHGGGHMMDRAFSGFTALPAPKSCWEILGVGPGAEEAAVNDAFRQRSKEVHPDRPGGSHTAMAELNKAREEAIRSLSKN
jgi:hypothetical protein